MGGLVFILWTTFVFVIGALNGKEIGSGQWQRLTVERGLALYCPADGEWAWVGECGK